MLVQHNQGQLLDCHSPVSDLFNSELLDKTILYIHTDIEREREREKEREREREREMQISAVRAREGVRIHIIYRDPHEGRLLDCVAREGVRIYIFIHFT